MNFRLAMLIAIGPSSGVTGPGFTNDSTPQSARLWPASQSDHVALHESAFGPTRTSRDVRVESAMRSITDEVDGSRSRHLGAKV